MSDGLDLPDLAGDVAIVTGGCGILGQGFARALAAAGAKVAVLDIDTGSAEQLARDIGAPHAIGIGCDVADEASIANAIERVASEWGRIDILLNNAATKTGDLGAFFAPFETYDLATWRAVMAVNIDGMFLMAKAAAPHLKASGRARVVQTASIYGLLGPDARIYEGSDYLGGPINTPAVYSASKAAVIGLTRWLATHWARDGIRVNCLVPGGVGSGQNETFESAYGARTPMGRMAWPEEITAAMLFLASRSSSYVTGQVLAADGGWTAW
ncbi:MAG: SDR family oxidoreductase [Erythrobacter sp.]|nr:SDR family oxidoreductase [Erythrobacter sp.]